MIQHEEFKSEIVFIEIPKDLSFGGVVDLTD